MVVGASLLGYSSVKVIWQSTLQPIIQASMTIPNILILIRARIYGSAQPVYARFELPAISMSQTKTFHENKHAQFHRLRLPLVACG